MGERLTAGVSGLQPRRLAQLHLVQTGVWAAEVFPSARTLGRYEETLVLVLTKDPGFFFFAVSI